MTFESLNKVSPLHLFVAISLLAIFFSAGNRLLCQEKITSKSTGNNVEYFYEPYPQKVGSSVLELGGTITMMPVPLVENEYPIPSIDLCYKRGLFENFSFEGKLNTNFYSNVLHLGLQWNDHKGPFSYGFSNRLGVFGGFLTAEGQFDRNSAYALYDMPVLKFGFRFTDFTVSTSLAFTYIFKCVSKISDFNPINLNMTVNDYLWIIALEQPFLKHSHVSMGFCLALSRSPYQMWILYNTINQYMFEPEFFFAFIL